MRFIGLKGLRRRRADEFLNIHRQSEDALWANVEARNRLGLDYENLGSEASDLYIERMIAALQSSTVGEACFHLLAYKCMDPADYAADRHAAALYFLQGEEAVSRAIMEQAWKLALQDGAPNDPLVSEWFHDLSRLTFHYRRYVQF
jgi:hypothetical protein